jgi:GH25 family lysozyme M1 (1,4-beta-N-acetylmuramidase)
MERRVPRRFIVPLVALCLLAVCSAGSAQAQTLRGIDVSMWQGANINWAAVKQSGVSFAFVKASQSRTFTDPQYASNALHARAAGVRVGAYDFADPKDGTHAQITANAIADADHFLAAARPQPTDLRPVLDVETTNGLTPAELTLWVNTWAGHVDDRIHARPFIYTSPSFWQTRLANTQTTAAAADLWIAHWTTAAQPTLPANGWDGLGWSFWQYSDCTRPRGTTGCVDGDRMHGSSFLPYLIGDVPSAAAAPAVSGTVAVGRTLTASAGRWRGTEPIDVSFQWQRCDQAGTHCRPISGETRATYRTVAADYLKRIRVRVSATNRLGETVASSVVTGRAADLDPPSVPVVAGVDGPFRQDASFTPSWQAADALSGIATYDVQTRVLSSGRVGTWTDAQSAAAATTIPMAGKPGQTTCVRVRATDQAHNTSRWSAPECTAASYAPASFARAGTWKPYGQDGAIRTTKAGAAVYRRRVVADEIGVRVHECSTCGRIAISFAGQVLRTLDLRRASEHDVTIAIAVPHGHRSGALRITTLTARRHVRILSVGGLRTA